MDEVIGARTGAKKRGGQTGLEIPKSRKGGWHQGGALPHKAEESGGPYGRKGPIKIKKQGPLRNTQSSRGGASREHCVVPKDQFGSGCGELCGKRSGRWWEKRMIKNAKNDQRRRSAPQQPT